MKKELRKKALAARRALSDEQRARYSREICELILASELLRGVKTVFSYLAAWDEADMALLHERLCEKGLSLAFPYTRPGGVMEARVPFTLEDTEEGPFGIKSPVKDRSRLIPPEDIDLVILPCVGFDKEGNRLGHGGGYYDRYLPGCKKALSICVAFEAQRLEDIPVEAHDINPGMTVTEKGFV